MERKKEVSNINIKEIKTLSDAGKLGELLSSVKQVKQSVFELSKKLGDKQKEFKRLRDDTAQLERERSETENLQIENLEEQVKKQPENVVELKKDANLDNFEGALRVKGNRSADAAVPSDATPKSDLIKKAVKAESIEMPKKIEKPQINQEIQAPSAEKPAETPSAGESVQEPVRIQRPKYIPPKPVVRTVSDRPERQRYVPQESRWQQNSPRGGTGQQGQAGTGRGGFNQQGQGYRGNNQQQGQTGRPQGNSLQPKPFAPRAAKPIGTPFVPKDNAKFAVKKKQTEKGFDEKRSANKKQSVKGALTVEDFDENKTGYRKLRVKKAQKANDEQRIVIEKAIVNKEIIPIKELSEKLGISAVDITKMLFKDGMIKTINDCLDYETAFFVAEKLGIDLELKLEKTAEDVLSEGFNEESDDAANYVLRPPVVTVMGHVDHGKTSLLDRIRSANVAAGEAGGITQHIGAYSITVKGNKITFLDTPGHAAFTAMRARGAQVTDIAVIVVAADDGIMPQSIEAINHAKAANVSIIVAANKIDKPQSNIDKVRQQLTDHDILVEDWGGDVMLVPVSAKTGEGIDHLLDSILLISDMRELKANPNRKAKGAVVEAKLDIGKGPVATMIIQNGTLRTGDNIVAGTIVGKVRAMFDDKGRMVKEAGPSMAVSVLGLNAVPNAGDIVFAVDQEKLTKLVAEERKNKEREEMIRQSQKVSLDELFSKISVGDLKYLNIIIKADVQGSVEAVKQSLQELSNDAVKVVVIHAGVGAISETDVMLSDSSNSIIIGFNVRPDVKAKALAERTKVDIKLYRIIYEAIDDITKAMKGMLAPKFKEVYMGKAEVRDTFKITGVGMIAGSYVTEGKILRNSKLRIYRDDVMICEGDVLQLKRFKDDVKEVAQGYECGISIKDFNDIKIGDFIESYVIEEQKII